MIDYLLGRAGTRSCPPTPLLNRLYEYSPTCYHIIFGLISGIPPCCIIEFCIRSHRKELVALKVGCAHQRAVSGFNCGYCHCWSHRRLHRRRVTKGNTPSLRVTCHGHPSYLQGSRAQIDSSHGHTQ